ncbi:hypothetical protein E8E13_008521 [Curvularia kusanoi]|uniref:F-box domain-containing protein n=1 Tax=Curvularia kusanoi TaxID=90978 RepID=A0A9P4TAW0_CURKU|nr:hypothetical protein E8E13_008521 [Curvularia kusanoi]
MSMQSVSGTRIPLLQGTDEVSLLNLLDLPTEVVSHVVKQVADRGDLARVRLACKNLDKHAAQELFKDVFVSMGEKDVDTWNKISGDDTIRQMPRHAIIHTQEKIDHRFRKNTEELEDWEEFENALNAMSRFPNLDSMEICFSDECIGNRDLEIYEDVAEDVSQRKEMLKYIFSAIQARAADKDNRPIRKLTFINLQNCPIPDFTSSPLFRDVMSQLDELHISLIHESNKHGPDHDYTREELQTFPAHLVSEWLAPISANLKVLSLYHSFDNWGPFPGYFDASSLSFPKLETLALGYYTLAHDNDIDWILNIKSLRKLILSNCMIASQMRIETENVEIWKPRTHDWTRTKRVYEEFPDFEFSDEGDELWDYDGTWSQNFDRIADALPNLVDFRFDMKQNGFSYAITERDDTGTRIFPQRYVIFDNGTLPTHWLEADEDGEIEAEYIVADGVEGGLNVHERHREKDQESLDRLMDVLKGRRLTVRTDEHPEGYLTSAPPTKATASHCRLDPRASPRTPDLSANQSRRQPVIAGEEGNQRLYDPLTNKQHSMPPTAETRGGLLLALARFKKDGSADRGFLYRLQKAVDNGVIQARDPTFIDAWRLSSGIHTHKRREKKMAHRKKDTGDCGPTTAVSRTPTNTDSSVVKGKKASDQQAQEEEAGSNGLDTGAESDDDRSSVGASSADSVEIPTNRGLQQPTNRDRGRHRRARKAFKLPHGYREITHNAAVKLLTGTGKRLRGDARSSPRVCDAARSAAYYDIDLRNSIDRISFRLLNLYFEDVPPFVYMDQVPSQLVEDVKALPHVPQGNAEPRYVQRVSD